MKKPLINANCISKFQDAIKFELGHEYMYRYLANIMQSLGYFGTSAYFLSESKEEGEHYQSHINFLNDLGILPSLPNIIPLSSSVVTLEDAIQVAYANELGLLEYYRKMYSDESKEYPEVREHLLFYLKVQREAVGFYGDILAMFTSELQNRNINMVIDHKLKKLS